MNRNVRVFLVLCALSAILGVVLYGLGGALGPLLISFGFAYLLFPLIRRIEAFGIRRQIAVSAVFLSVLVVAIAGTSLVVPRLVSEGRSFLTELPENSSRAISKIERLSAEFGYEIDLTRQGVKEFITDHTSKLSLRIVKVFSEMIRSAFTDLLNWLLAALNLFLIPLFFFYVIHDYERISEEIISFVPNPFQPRMRRYAQATGTILNGFIRGQIIVAGILAILYGLGLYGIGLRFGLLIGIATGFMSIIPYAGFTFGFLAALIVFLANFTGFGLLFGIVAVFLTVQLIDGLFITPRLVGNQVGLSPFATLLALIIGGNLLGLTGMLIAIPSAAVLKFIVADLKREYQPGSLPGE